jgi:putative transposase
LQYFITQVTYQRQPWLCREIGRYALRIAINQVRATRPFAILLCCYPIISTAFGRYQNDSDVSTRLRLIKTYVTRHYGTQLGLDMNVSDSRRRRKECNLWQRRFWEHLIRDETDFARHCDYIHYNLVHHQLCQVPTGCQFSSVHRLITKGIYPPNWGECPVEFGLDGRWE